MLKQITILILVVLFNTLFAPTATAQIELKGSKNKLQIKSDISKLNKLFEETNPDSINTRIALAKEACLISKNTDNCIDYIHALLNLGRAYNKQYRYDLAMETYFEALKISDSIKAPENRADILHEIGTVYLDIRNLDLAHEYLTEALKIKNQRKDKKGLASTNNRLAVTYWLKGELDTALSYLFEALKTEELFENPEGIAKCYNNIGIVYHEKHEFKKALTYHEKALKIKREQKSQWAIAETLNNIAETYISMGDYKAAMPYLTEARQIATKINALVLLSDNYRYMARLYKRTKKYKEALNYHELFVNLEDSLYSQNKYSMINELKSSFEIEKREQSIKLQKKEIELLKKQKKIDNLQKAILAVVIFFILSIGGILYNRQKRINHRNKQLIEKDKQIKETQAILVEKEREEKNRLLIELNQKNKFLVDFGLYISMKNEFLVKLKDDLKQLARQDKQNPELRQIVYQVNQNLRYNNELIGLQENVEKVNYDFINKLLKSFPDITENEKQLSIFLRLNFSSKEIANLRAVSIKAVEMSRYRLRKRFKLDNKDSLSSFLRNF